MRIFSDYFLAKNYSIMLIHIKCNIIYLILITRLFQLNKKYSCFGEK